MTLTNFDQLRSYWWDATSKSNKVTVQLRHTGDIRVNPTAKLRYLGPLNSASERASLQEKFKALRESEFFKDRSTKGFKVTYG